MAKGLSLLTARNEEILRAVHVYRYMSALDVAWLLFSPSSLTHVREILSRLAGGKDCVPNQYLYRFPYVTAEAGNAIRVYTLGSRGRDFLASVCGLPVDWYFRPEKVRHLSHNQVLHNLTLTRVLVSAAKLNKWRTQLAEMRTCYELVRGEGIAEPDQEARRALGRAVPDAWLKFERLTEDRSGHEQWYPVLLEIDRGREYKRRFQEHVLARVELIRSGAYERVFGIESVQIAYLTTAGTALQRQTRRRAMSDWTREVLQALGLEDWSQIFLFGERTLEDLYSAPVFDTPMWQNGPLNKSRYLF